MARLNYEDMVIIDGKAHFKTELTENEREIFCSKISNRFEGRKISDSEDKSKTMKEKCGLKHLKLPKPNNYNVKG